MTAVGRGGREENGRRRVQGGEKSPCFHYFSILPGPSESVKFAAGPDLAGSRPNGRSQRS